MVLWLLVPIFTIHPPYPDCQLNYALDKFESSLLLTALCVQAQAASFASANNIFPIPLAPYLNSHSPSAAPSLPMGSACIPPLQENGQVFLNNPLGVISRKLVLLNLRSPYHHVPRCPPSFSAPATLFRCKGLNLNIHIILLTFTVL